MKKLIFTLVTLGMVGVGVQNAAAGDREWAAAGKVLTGLLAAKVVAQALEPAPVVTYSATTYYQPAPVVVSAPPPAAVYYYQPAPVVVYQPPVYVQPVPVVTCRQVCGGPFCHRPHFVVRW